MKKVLAIVVVAGFLAACNSGENKEKLAADSTRVADSTRQAWVADSTAKATATPDTTKAATDTTKK